MNITGSESGRSVFPTLQNFKLRPGLAFGIIILTALLAFEIFNYSTTDYALRDLLGELNFAGVRWATILSIAFCGIDFAGIARLFTPEQNSDEPKEVWYLFGAWLLAATMNAILTWWGVSMAVMNHSVVSSQSVVDPNTLTKIVPVFVAIMVWVIRILIIGSLSYAGDRIFSDGSHKTTEYTPSRRSQNIPAPSRQPDLNPAMMAAPRPAVNRGMNARPATHSNTVQRPASVTPDTQGLARPEPTYHSLGARPASRPSIGEKNNNHRT
jgi:hypothetical protein